MGKYYPPDYYSIPSSIEQLAAVEHHELYKIEIVQRFAAGGRLLEIGPATGGFTRLAKQAGYEVEVIEMDARCCEFLAEVVGVRAINSNDAKTALLTTDSYDIIALWHVIEHLPDPLETLQAAAEKLLPGGILILAAPNPEAFQFRVLKRYWTHVDAPRHVLLIPLQTLVKRVEELGLKVVMQTTTDAGTLGWNSFGWQESLGNFFTEQSAKSRMRRIGGALAWYLSPIEQSGLRGSTYTAVFQKAP
ncbi:MAG: class I SAM-dependent methyltransferase [Pyrinomonadaceae bacterium]